MPAPRHDRLEPAISCFGYLLNAVWIVSLALVLLTLCTPLEFDPLPFANLPRWGLWGLAWPACRSLQAYSRWRFPLRLVPWLLWAPLLLAQAGWLFMSPLQPSPEPWSTVLAPLAGVFARSETWHTRRVLFRRGWQAVLLQREEPMGFYPRQWRIALRTPLLPGVQWVQRLRGERELDASWHLVDPQDVAAHPHERWQAYELTADSTLRQALHPPFRSTSPLPVSTLK